MQKYDENSIQQLKGLEAVRKRPGMYIGSTDVNGLHHLVWEIVDNSIDEALAGAANVISVILTKSGSVIVKDNGRGVPVGKTQTGKTAVERVFTELHTGGKFDESAYKTSGGLHGVGASVVNALSTKLIATVHKDGGIYETVFENGGEITQKTKLIGKTKENGTIVEFWPNYEVFKRSKLSYEKISERLRESSFLIAGLKIILIDEIRDQRDEFQYENGISAFVEFMNDSKNAIGDVFTFRETKRDIEVECGFQYTDSYNETILSFVNNVKTKDGGTHESGLKSALTKTFNEIAMDEKMIKGKNTFDGDDIREGLTIIISVKIPEKYLEFVSQTKDKLGTPEAKSVVEEVALKHLKIWSVENKPLVKKILDKIKKAAEARASARKARAEARSTKNALKEKQILSGKLTPAQSRNASEKELFLVEGDSAGGTAKKGRDRKFQAILPLRGKVLNTEKARLYEILKNEEIATIINTIGAGVGDDFDIKKAQYGKVVIMTDADTDGAHIQILLLTFFFRHMRELVDAGMVYIALPPLFKVTSTRGKKEIIYAWDELELKDILQQPNFKNAEIQRYKGLGEMNADQIWETTMNPETRTLIQVKINDVTLAERRVSTLMGDNAEPRKEWINANVEFSLEDDYEI
ncbi:DNA topoisomerase IV subunit B [Mycoplasma zalophidermidis]|uniref:DNA topoisomerase (ATP-hydrolyzing) n=1 Tax=Mycoplasma zalophidermidis TaxID=398174 RepID=A0ABS6DR47_9MOLU|nr:DNA topoisomerase IV subunit B [Mycoplasma zalophidermidis]MBU4689576.1 DNA topoisomerase IV subunit B [Mycoplasma zalophidermidis]MBU4693473.1 DNA topoisomerase IV subunit B [Mycoplasma zalophidermidis]MCR8966245.1 DNA topoisomerase IV subunit B [Mycoplasma zalophidermidis]